MQDNYNESDLEAKLLNNSLLFSSIRKNKTPEEKIKKIKKFLDHGADINATDANYKNNTPLHVAVMKEELEVINFLLERGALVNNKNSDDQTALDIARRSEGCKRKEIVSILEKFNNNKLSHASNQRDINTVLTKSCNTKKIQNPKDICSLVACDMENQTQSQVVQRSVKNKKVVQNKPKQQKCSKESKKSKGKEIFNYQKRTGTSALSGQLYETKLLTLILFRALYVQEVETFLIATNVENMGAFDDIVFRFYLNESDKPKIMFVQAKHRDNPANKDKFTVEEVMKLNGDFSLHKYLESYIKISQMFVPENSDDMFRGEFKNMDCEFIIYTSAYENFSKRKNVESTLGKRFINTNENNIFQFDYDDKDVEILMETVAKSRAVLLAKRLSRFIFKDNYSNMMLDDFIKTYHVYLARHILEVKVTEDNELQNNFNYAKFRESFFSSKNDLLLAFKGTIFKEVLLQKKNISPENPDEVESILMSLTFKVPVNFGNLNFCFSGSEQEKEKELEYLCSNFKQLFAIANVSANIVMKMDDNMVEPNEIFQSTDLETYTLEGLVGNLLVFDDETKTLKFNSDVDILSEDNLKLLDRLKSDVFVGIDLSNCRFDINVHPFPRLSLVHDKYDKNLIVEFLSKLTFYTNQATEDRIESILKDEIDKCFMSSISRQSDALFRVKSDAIFIKVHDCVQNWWKQPIVAPYLTESCQYFFKTEQDILSSPILNILNFTYTNTLRKSWPEFKFKDAALKLLKLEDFLKSSEKILSIITEEIALSSIKVMQCFEEHKNDYTFIDLNYVVNGNYFVDVKSEIRESKLSTLIVVCNSNDVAEMNMLIKHFKGKVITISNRNLSNEINRMVTENIVNIFDGRTGFVDLADKMCEILLKQRYIVFQGIEVVLSKLFEDESYHLINSNLLYKIINNENIKIGNYLNNPAYDEISDVYLNEEVCRYIRLDPDYLPIVELNALKYIELGEDFSPDTREIILITDKQEEFTEFVNMHDCYVHWFSSSYDWLRRKEFLVWQKSRGNLLNLLKHIERSAYEDYSLTLETLQSICEKLVVIQPVTLKDVREKVVIISGEPGTGKSSLLTHLAINTKHKFPELWISKINLLEHTRELKRIKENKVNIDLKESVQFLFRVLDFEAYKKKTDDFEILINTVSVIDNFIRFDNNEVKVNIEGLNLFEIELFIYCYNNGRVVLLFDGFDEICPDFANEFIQLVNFLKMSKVVHLWITSRLYNVLHQLENALETFSFTIRPLPRDSQVLFLKKLLLRKFGPNKPDHCPVDKDQFQDSAVKFRDYLLTALQNRDQKFLTIPLYLYMMVQIFQDHFFNNSYSPHNVNPSKIYELFVDAIFFKIRFGDKKPLLCVNDPDIRQLIDTERSAFLHIHKIIGAYCIFDYRDDIKIFDGHDIDAMYDFFEKIKVGDEKTGIIQRIIHKNPKFTHYTFAEYFATEFLCDKLKSFHCRSTVWKYLIELFVISEIIGTRSFFRANIENNPLMYNEVQNADLIKLFETLLLEHDKLTWALFKAIDSEFVNFSNVLLKFTKAVVCDKNLDDFINVLIKKSYHNEQCIVCSAVNNNAKNVIISIIELIKDIDIKRLIDLYICSDLPNFNPLVVSGRLRESLLGNGELLDILLIDLTPTALVDLFCQQITHGSQKIIHILIKSWLQGEIGSEWFEITVGKLNREQLVTIFSATDSENMSAAHTAAIEQSYIFFDQLEFILDKSQFKEICMARDRSVRTPIHYFRYTEQDCDMLKILLDKVYEGNMNEKLTLDYFIDQSNETKEQ